MKNRLEVLLGLLLLGLLSDRALAQATPGAKGKTPPEVPTISTRFFTGGSAKVIVTGGIPIDGEIPINIPASYGDGEKTWLQFGASGSKEPNAAVIYGDGEIGVNVGLGKKVATAERANCSGQAEVTATSITGEYTCKGITAYDAGTGKMSQVDITIRFTAKS